MEEGLLETPRCWGWSFLAFVECIEGVLSSCLYLNLFGCLAIGGGRLAGDSIVLEWELPCACRVRGGSRELVSCKSSFA